MSERVCSVAECGRKVLARGWCNRHWLQWSRHGSPAGRTTPKALRSDRLPIAIGERRGFMILVREVASPRAGRRFVDCQCDCGNLRTKDLGAWKATAVQSCGCRRAEMQASKIRTHGKSYDRVYNIWKGMVDRCTNPENPNWARYGGRGITVCDRWLLLDNFHADMGDPPADMQIERDNNDGNYEPSNCRWATRIEQANNRSNNTILSAFGESLTISEWSRKTGINNFAITLRLRRGWDAARAVSEPLCTKYLRKGNPTMNDPDGAEERTAFYEDSFDRSEDAADVAEMLGDESRHVIDWVTDEKLIALARQRLAMDRG